MQRTCILQMRREDARHEIKAQRVWASALLFGKMRGACCTLGICHMAQSGVTQYESRISIRESPTTRVRRQISWLNRSWHGWFGSGVRKEKTAEVCLLNTVLYLLGSFFELHHLQSNNHNLGLFTSCFFSMVCYLLPEWCITTSFYQRVTNHVSFYAFFHFPNLWYLII